MSASPADVVARIARNKQLALERLAAAKARAAGPAPPFPLSLSLSITPGLRRPSPARK